jgi:hypothetical protein
LSFYVVVDLILSPGTSISPAQKVKLACQQNGDNVRKAWSEMWGYIYVPTPLFINNSFEEARGEYGSKKDIAPLSISTVINQKYDNVKGDDFFDAMERKINTSNDYKGAFANLTIASNEYNNLLKQHNISTEDLNNLITEAKYKS